MRVRRVALEKYTSNVFILEPNESQLVWLIDIGEFEPVRRALSGTKEIAGVFLTHPHYDHIGGVNSLVECFPNCKIFGSSKTLEALQNPKENLSFYHEEPVVFSGSSCVSLDSLDEIGLVTGNSMKIFKTPGHYSGSLSYKLFNYWFTGDSLVPGYPVVTKLKGGDRVLNQLTLDFLFGAFLRDDVICPGHGEIVLASNLNRKEY
ncbi:MAG: MBL fold metallo-hydrolase [Bacteroidia bacterium]|nr:MBL fold metallo-hydrolase [Bacteroidia bacterium]